jgi:hypothetical protein
MLPLSPQRFGYDAHVNRLKNHNNNTGILVGSRDDPNFVSRWPITANPSQRAFSQLVLPTNVLRSYLLLARLLANAGGSHPLHCPNSGLFVLGCRSLARTTKAQGDAGQHARNYCLFVLGIIVCSSWALARSAPRGAGRRWATRSQFVSVRAGLPIAPSPPKGARRRWAARSQFVSVRACAGLSLARSPRNGAGRRWATRSHFFSVRAGISLAPEGRWATLVGQLDRNYCLFVPVLGSRSLAPQPARATRPKVQHARNFCPLVPVLGSRSPRKGAGRHWATHLQ